MWGVSASRTVVIGMATIVFVVSSVAPLVYMLGTALVASTTSWSVLTTLLLDGRQRTLLYNTATLGLWTAVLATVIGMPLGIALARIDLPRKRALRVLLAAPMVLPPHIAALAWVSLGGGAGLLAELFGPDVLSTWTYSMPAAIVILALVLYPISMLATEVALRRIEPHLEEAALIVTAPSGALWRITLRLAAPGVSAAALVIFVLAISDFGVPGVLRVRVFTTEVFTAFAALYDFGRATIMAVPLLVLAVALAAVAVGIAGDQLVTTRRGLTHGLGLLLDEWRSAGVAACLVVAIVALIVPLGLLLRESSGVRSWTAVFEGSSGAIRNSLVFSAAGATLTTGLGLILGYARARASRRMGFAADVTFVVLFAVPSTVVGVGLIALWNRPGPMGALYGTGAMLLLVYLARLLPLASLGMAAALRHVPQSHEEAAAAAGAGWTLTMARIVVPQLSTALMTVWVVVFVLAFGELGASILVSPPGETTLPIRIYTLIANAPPAQVAALAALQSAVILVPLAILAWAMSRLGQR
jgi:iron(III) transport system permease protein